MTDANGPCNPIPGDDRFSIRYTLVDMEAAQAAGAEAMRKACAAIVDAHAAAAKRCSEEADVIYRIRAEFLANSHAITQAADDVRVTPTPAPDALARMIAEAEARGMERAAGVADDHHKIATRAVADEWGYSGSAATRARIESRAYEASRIAAAIRAAAKEIKA